MSTEIKTKATTGKPKWLRVKLPTGKKYTELRGLVDQYKLNTICTSGSSINNRLFLRILKWPAAFRTAQP